MGKKKKKWKRNNKYIYIYFYVLSVCSDRVRQLSDFSHETSCRDSSPLGSTASAQINHGWLQRRTKRPFQALSHEPQSLRTALFSPSFGRRLRVVLGLGWMQKGDAPASESTVCAAGTKERRQSHCARSTERYYVIGK